jgi:hypothetical protein
MMDSENIIDHRPLYYGSKCFIIIRSYKKSRGVEATPSEWKPGKMTSKTGSDIIGNACKIWKTKTAFEALLQEGEAYKEHGIR